MDITSFSCVSATKKSKQKCVRFNHGSLQGKEREGKQDGGKSEGGGEMKRGVNHGC